MGGDIGRHSSGGDSVAADPFRSIESSRALGQTDQAVLADSVCGAYPELVSTSTSEEMSQCSLTTSPSSESSKRSDIDNRALHSRFQHRSNCALGDEGRCGQVDSYHAVKFCS